MNQVNQYGVKWKIGKGVSHLKTRKEYGHITEDFTLKDYEHVIISVMNGIHNDVFLYYLKGFKKDYFIFGDGIWIVIVGEDGIMETAFQIHKDKRYHNYLSEKKGYKYIGKVKEVLV